MRIIRIKNNYAFTLIELIGVIVLLGILMLLVFPSIMNGIKKSEKELDEAGKKLLYSSTELYLENNSDVYPKEEGKKYCIAVKTLLDSKMLESDRLVNGMKETDTVEVTIEDGQYQYSINTECTIQLLKERIENDTPHMVNDVTVNGQTVNKVIGNKSEKLTMKNYVWYMGQLWQVMETNDTNHSIKLITAHGVSSIVYGKTSDWSTSWVKKWLSEVFLRSLEGTDLMVSTNFCLDTVNVTSNTETDDREYDILNVLSHTPIRTCSNETSGLVGLMTFEDYVYANKGNHPMYTGGSYLDEDEYTWIMTPYDNTKTWITWFLDPSIITTSSSVLTNTYGRAIRPVISITDEALIQSGDGTKKNPFVLINERKVSSDSVIATTKVGDYVYLEESNNPNLFDKEYVARDLSYVTTKDKVRYRVVKKNDDGSVKVERADILRNLPNTIAFDVGICVPYYYKATSDGCYYNTSEAAWYVSGCNDHNYFQKSGNTGIYDYHNSINIGDYLNSSSNVFFSWYSERTKMMIKEETYHRYTDGHGKDYSNLNNDLSTVYPSRTNDGDIIANVVLPMYGEMYSGNDLNSSYWTMNRWAENAVAVTGINERSTSYNFNASHYTMAIRPVVTLKSTVKVKSGSGTMVDPYVLY